MSILFQTADSIGMDQLLNNKRLRATLGCLLLGALSFLAPSIDVIQRIEQFTLDFRYQHLNRKAAPPNYAVLVDIDEQSLKQLAKHYGRWPWPRRVYKELLSFLSIGNPQSIYFDILFTEPMLATSDDKILGQISNSLGIVSHAAHLLPEGESSELPSTLKNSIHIEVGGQKFPFKNYGDILLPTKNILDVHKKVHVVTFPEDEDGLFRRAPLLFRYDGAWLPSLSLAAVLSQLREATLKFQNGKLHIQSRKQNFKIPLDETGALPIHFYRKEAQPKSYSAVSLISAFRQIQQGEIENFSALPVDPFEFEGKTIIIGTSASGLKDLKPTPINSVYPGALLHASAISNILNKDHLRHLARSWQNLLTLILVIGSYLSIVLLSSKWKLGLSVVLSAIYLFGAAYSFSQFSIKFDIAVPMLLWLFAFLEGFVFISFFELAQKKRLEKTLSKYLSPEVTKKLISLGSNPQAEVGREEELSILFADIVGFTKISENTSPETLVTQLNAYLSYMTDIIFQHNGTLDKFIGDGIFCFWGAPISDPDHALKAAQCALAMQNLPPHLRFKTSIGINTGKAIVGNLGSDRHLDYTAIGDNVNLASRIEGLTREFNTTTLIGENTYKSICSQLPCRKIGNVRVKGKEQAVNIYEPLSEEKYQRIIKKWEQAMTAFHCGNYEQALRYFSRITELDKNDGPSQVYRQRCRTLIASPSNYVDAVYGNSKA